MTRTFHLPSPTTVRQRLGLLTGRHQASPRTEPRSAVPHRTTAVDSRRHDTDPAEQDAAPTWRQRVRYQW